MTAEEEAAKAAQVQSKRLKGKSYRDAADALEQKEKGKVVSPQPLNGQSIRKRLRTLIDSVEIPAYSSKSTASSASSGADENDDDDYSGGNENENENVVDVKKGNKKKKKVKAPKVTVAEAASKINGDEFATFLAEITVSFCFCFLCFLRF